MYDWSLLKLVQNILLTLFKDYTQNRMMESKVFSCEISWQVCGEATTWLSQLSHPVAEWNQTPQNETKMFREQSLNKLDKIYIFEIQKLHFQTLRNIWKYFLIIFN